MTSQLFKLTKCASLWPLRPGASSPGRWRKKIHLEFRLASLAISDQPNFVLELERLPRLLAEPRPLHLCPSQL